MQILLTGASGFPPPIEPSKTRLQSSETLKKSGIKNMDAIHLASADVFGCDFFITSCLKKQNA